MLYKLVLSSHLFLANSIYAHKINEKCVAFLLFIVYLCSTLHHITHTNNSCYHIIDCFVSRSATIVLFPYSMQYSQSLFCFMGINNIILSYGISRYVHNAYDDLIWTWCHMYFHLLTNMYIYFSLTDCKIFKFNCINYYSCSSSLGTTY